MSRTSFKLKTGNNPSFKMIGSSPVPLWSAAYKIGKSIYRTIKGSKKVKKVVKSSEDIEADKINKMYEKFKQGVRKGS